MRAKRLRERVQIAPVVDDSTRHWGAFVVRSSCDIEFDPRFVEEANCGGSRIHEAFPMAGVGSDWDERDDL
jgi:hypothetical protein